jgi:hypothetical protein
MSIKVKIGASQRIKSVPKQSDTRPVVAPGEKKPVIVPDSIVLGIDTIGPYVASVDAGPGIVVSPEVNNETANLVISHVNTSDEANTVNDNFGFVRNVNIDEFGHVTNLFSTSLDSLNFTSNGTFITAKDIGLGTTSLTIGESTNRIQGLESFNVGSLEFANNSIFSADKLIITTDVVDVNSSGGLIIPVGTNADRPAGANVAQGMIRYNTTDSQFEGYDGSVWKGIGGVIDINQDTKIIAEASPGINNDQLQFFTFGVERLQLDADGSFKFGNGLNKVVIDYDTGNTVFAGTVLVNSQTTLASANVLDLLETGIVFAGPNGELDTSDMITWDGVQFALKGGLSIDGDFSTEGGLSGDSLSVGNLSANTIVFIGEGGVLQSNSSLQYDGFRFDLTTPAFFYDEVKLDTLTAGRVVVTGTDGLLQDDSDLLWDGTNLDVSSINVRDLTSGRLVLAGANGSLEDSSQLSFNGTTLFVDGDANITGSVTIGGNITVGDQELDTISVVADFTSNLIPRDDNTYVIGKAGQNWNAVYTRRLDSDTEIITVDTTGALVVPVGNTDIRPVSASTGMLRFNTTDVQFEGYDGSVWKGLGGVIDVNQDTKIIAETSPGVNNDELEFYTNGNRVFLISNTGVITTDAGKNLVFNIGGGTFDVGNSIITGILDPVNSLDAVNLNYLENTFSSNATFVDGSNNYTISLLNNPIINTGSGLEVVAHSEANNSIELALDKTGVSPDTYGREGFVPQIVIGEDGRVSFALDIPLTVSSNAVVDFTESISDVVIQMVTGNTEEGITVTGVDSTDKLNFRTNDFTVTLTGAVTGNNTVIHNSNTIIATEFDYVTLDERYLNTAGDTATGDIAAPRFVDSANTIYWADPAGTSRFRNLIIGYGQTQSLLEMKDGVNTSAYIYAGNFTEGLQIGFLNDSFNFAAYANRQDSTWWVRNETYASRFVDRNNTTYFVNPASTDSRIRALNIDNNIIVNSILTLDSTGISSSQDLILNISTGIIDANTSIIKNVSNPIDALDVVNKQYLETELNSLLVNGISISAESGNTDIIALGETIIFAAGEGINTIVSNNQILIEGELANTTNVGVASFSDTNFNVSVGGEVTVAILDGGTF